MPTPSLSIASRRLAADAPSFVIAEIGVNHDGRLDTALRLVEAAWVAGADAVKLQLFRASKLVHARAGLASYQRASGEQSPAEMLRRYELSDEEVETVVAAIWQTGLIPLATPFSPEDVARIAALELPAVKLASPDLVNPLLVDAAADLNVPLILSTGAATTAEIDASIDRLRTRGPVGSAGFALLHCVSAYPTPDAAAEIGRVRGLAERFDCIAGLSDHTQHGLSGAIAVANGARVIEKHLTHDRNARGPDHSASASPREFAEYVRHIRQAEMLLGVGRIGDRREVGEHERDVRVQSRQSLVARCSIRPGQTITADLLTCQRPGTGIPAGDLERVVGRTVVREVPAGAMFDWSDFAAAPAPACVAA